MPNWLKPHEEELRRATMRILLAIDGSGHSEAAVREVDGRHLSAESEVRVISVVEPIQYYYAGEYPGAVPSISPYAEVEKASGEGARAAVESATAKLRSNGEARQLRVTTDVISGSPKQVILDEAERFGADLIIVGSHGHGGMVERFLLGSVSLAVAQHARCSVEIVRIPKPETPMSGVSEP